MYLANFNSIKVQLELITWLLHIKACKFQFHKGTIRTNEELIGYLLVTEFQFHKGTIRTRTQTERLRLFHISIP